MTAYMLAMIDVRDPSWVRDYAAAVPLIHDRYGCKHLAFSGPITVAEGDAAPPQVVQLFSYPNEKAIHDFLADADYAPWRAKRINGSKSTIWTFENTLDDQNYGRAIDQHLP